ncbi:nuclease [Aminobacter sp. MET-1]|uniref:nuclease n=1 Tax=Aminobacter sp. MET-1 TaxID=2951085 RepID=UPI00226AE929|nr:nuclease [Aminobacter sp. MET-1]MCX8571107.1 nuclease [Aminobacter sp. MET-1]MCX8573224.1 nuclease [Aminobacter sp. MET-1]
MRGLVLRILAALAASTANVAAQQQASPSSAKFVDYYQNAYSQGRDLIPGPQTALDPASLINSLKLETVTPEAALTGAAFIDANNTVIKLAGIQGCLSTQQLRMSTSSASCSMISLAGLNAALQTASAPAGGAFPCHFLATNTGNPPVRFAECFFIKEDDSVQPLSEYIIRQGFAFAARSPNGMPLFPEYAAAESDAAKAKAGIWANSSFVHPYGERYRNLQMN